MRSQQTRNRQSAPILSRDPHHVTGQSDSIVKEQLFAPVFERKVANAYGCVPFATRNFPQPATLSRNIYTTVSLSIPNHLPAP
jgi:hypothetical protein